MLPGSRPIIGQHIVKVVIGIKIMAVIAVIIHSALQIGRRVSVIQIAGICAAAHIRCNPMYQSSAAVHFVMAD